jgi:orotate phosphoribosyltransferase
LSKQAFDTLVKLKAIITNDHILYTSGKHGAEYVNKDALYPHTEEVSRLCEIMANAFLKDKVDVVVAPAVGGIVLTQWIAHHLTIKYGKQVLAVYAEKQSNGEFDFKRGYGKHIEGKNILVAEDVLNTGGSAKKVVELVQDNLGIVIGLAVIANRGGVKPDEVGHVPKIFSLVDIDFKAYDPSDCPLCKKGIPLSMEYGKGAKS